jgi:transcriptional antiterminator RfaH
MTQSWHCIFTKVARERDAAQEINGKGFETYYPLYTRQRTHNHRRETVIGPLFPRYIFAQFDRELPGWAQIKSNSRFVFDILKDGMGRPIPVPLWAIEAMKSRSTDQQEATQPDPEYAMHQKVRIKEGLLRGCEGLFIGTAHQRRIALLTMMGKRWELNIGEIEPV